MFAVTPKLPTTFAPVVVTTNTLATAPTLVFTLPFATGIFTLLVPLLIPLPLGILIVANTPLPNNTCVLELFKLIVAILPIPTTLATATLLAMFA